MKATFITDEATQDPDVFIPMAQRHRLDAVELRSVWGERLIDLSTQQRAELRRRLDDAGLSVCCVCTPFFKSPFDTDLDAEYDLLRAYIDVAQELGTLYLRIFSFWRSPDRAARLDAITERLVRAGRLVEGHPVKLLIENGKRTMHCSGEELRGLLEQLDDSVFGALWDPGNSIFGGCDPDPVNRGFPAVERWVAHVHIKDPAVYDGGRQYVELGTGQLDLKGQVEGLVKAGYSAYLSLETHWRSGFVIDEAQLDYPYGADFSRSGSHATDASLGVLRSVIEGVLSRAP